MPYDSQMTAPVRLSNVERAKRQGASAFHNGKRFNENPYDALFQAKERVLWSKGHNEARAAALQHVSRQAAGRTSTAHHR